MGIIPVKMHGLVDLCYCIPMRQNAGCKHPVTLYVRENDTAVGIKKHYDITGLF